MQYTVYMPATGGTVTITAKGGSSLPVAGQVAASQQPLRHLAL
jgi:hypothetical protein